MPTFLISPRRNLVIANGNSIMNRMVITPDNKFMINIFSSRVTEATLFGNAEFLPALQQQLAAQGCSLPQNSEYLKNRIHWNIQKL